MSVFSVTSVLGTLQATPSLGVLDLTTVIRFIRLASALKPYILHYQDPSFSPKDIPADLPREVRMYLQLRLCLPADQISGLWTALRVLVWVRGAAAFEEDDTLRMHGEWDARLGARQYYSF